MITTSQAIQLRRHIAELVKAVEDAAHAGAEPPEIADSIRIHKRNCELELKLFIANLTKLEQK